MWQTSFISGKLSLLARVDNAVSYSGASSRCGASVWTQGAVHYRGSLGNHGIFVTSFIRAWR